MPVFVPLKRLRQSAGLTQAELSLKIGFSYQQIQKIEQGKIKMLSLEMIDKLCEALRCKPGDLLEEMPNKKTEA
jgi:putative transcriptional regulator